MRFVWLFALFWLLSGWIRAEPVAWDANDEHWLTQESDHFRIHYLSQHQDLAQYSLDIAEQVHKDLLPFFGQAPERKTDMVLTDDFDFSNG